MKVLHISTEMGWRGGEHQVRLLTNGLAQQNCESHLAFPKKAEIFHYVRDFPYLELFSKRSYDPRNINQLISYCDSHKIEILHAHSSGGHSLAIAIKKNRPHLKLIVHRRVAFDRKLNWFSRRKYLAPQVDCYIAISKMVAQNLHQQDVPQNKVHLIYDSIDLNDYENLIYAENRKELLQNWNLSNDNVILGTASALTKEKGLTILLRALEQLATHKPNIAVLIAGNGPERGLLTQRLLRLNLPFPVRLIGFIDNTPQFLSGLDIFVMPSLSEGLGSTALQALAAGRCVVCSDAGGLPEIIENEITGLIAKRGNAQDLADQLLRAIENPSLRSHLGEKGLSVVAKKYSLESMVQNTLNIYKEILSTNHG